MQINITTNHKEFAKRLNSIQKQYIPKAKVRSLNRTATTVRKEAVTKTYKDMGSTASAVRNRMSIVKATKNSLVSKIIATGKAFKLIHFKARQTKKGVTSTAWGKRKLYKGTFIAAVNGNKFVFTKRKEKNNQGRRKLKILFGPAVSQTTAKENIKKAIEKLAFSVFKKEFRANLKYYLSRK